MVVYKITNLINGKCYIGQTTGNVKYRWRQHKNSSKYKNKSILGLAIAKYGKDNFTFEVLENCSIDQLDDKERYYIKFYNSLTPNGYNMETGGNSLKKLSKETIHKIKATRKRVSVIATNVKTGKEIFYESLLAATKDGFTMSAIVKCCKGKYSLHNEHYWRFSNEPKKEHKVIKIKTKPKSVIGIHKITGEILEFNSINAASKIGFGRKEIDYCCRGIYSQHKNYIWKYKE